MHAYVLCMYIFLHVVTNLEYIIWYSLHSFVCACLFCPLSQYSVVTSIFFPPLSGLGSNYETVAPPKHCAFYGCCDKTAKLVYSHGISIKVSNCLLLASNAFGSTVFKIIQLCSNIFQNLKLYFLIVTCYRFEFQGQFIQTFA